jgi:hypothetical protein
MKHLVRLFFDAANVPQEVRNDAEAELKTMAHG